MNWVENFFRMITGDSELSSADQTRAYEDFKNWFHKEAKGFLFTYDEDEVYDQIGEVTESLLKYVMKHGLPEKPENFLVRTVHNSLKQLFRKKETVNRYSIKKQIEKIILDLENSGVLHSIEEKTGFPEMIESETVDSETLSGYIALEMQGRPTMKEMVLGVIRAAGGVVIREDLIEEWLDYKLARVPVPIEPSEDDDNPETNDERDVDLLPGEKMVINEAVGTTFSQIERLISESPKITDHQLIIIIYMYIGGYTLRETTTVTGIPRATIDYYLSERANLSVKSILAKNLTLLRGSLPGRGAGEVTAWFGDGLYQLLQENYRAYILENNRMAELQKRSEK